MLERKEVPGRGRNTKHKSGIDPRFIERVRLWLLDVRVQMKVSLEI